MGRTIALSNLSLLPTSLFFGPQAAWEAAASYGFDALKINPLRGWTAEKIQQANIPISAFEAPWCFSFLDTLKTVWKGHLRALLIDTILFGYRSSDRLARSYATTFPGILGVDCPADYAGDFIRVQETDADKRTNPCALIAAQTPLLFDTWHIRGYPDHEFLLRKLKKEGLIRGIDVQTRDIREWKLFLGRQAGLLARQLEELRSLPDEVSASVEIHPAHLNPLGKYLNLPSKKELFPFIQQAVRAALG